MSTRDVQPAQFAAMLANNARRLAELEQFNRTSISPSPVNIPQPNNRAQIVRNPCDGTVLSLHPNSGMVNGAQSGNQQQNNSHGRQSLSPDANPFAIPVQSHSQQNHHISPHNNTSNSNSTRGIVQGLSPIPRVYVEGTPSQCSQEPSEPRYPVRDVAYSEIKGSFFYK